MNTEELLKQIEITHNWATSQSGLIYSNLMESLTRRFENDQISTKEYYAEKRMIDQNWTSEKCRKWDLQNAIQFKKKCSRIGETS